VRDSLDLLVDHQLSIHDVLEQAQKCIPKDLSGRRSIGCSLLETHIFPDRWLGFYQKI
jgi:hypothetical protein